jgi:hypothetical protein
MATVPNQRELDETIARLTARYAASSDPRARHLMEVYARLSARFSDDLSDRRDIALSRGAALMMVKYLLEGSRAAPPLPRGEA